MREAHIIVKTDRCIEPSQLARWIEQMWFNGDHVEAHYHEHEEAPGGVIVGWDVLVVTSHESHNAATLHAEVERERNPAADVELQPVLGNPPGEEAA